MMLASWFTLLLVTLFVDVTGFHRAYHSGLSIQRIRNRISQKAGRYDVMKDIRYQEELDTIKNFKIQELLNACKQDNIDVNGVSDRYELEYRLIVHRLLLKYGKDTQPARSSLSHRAYAIELEKEIERLKKLPNERFQEELFEYNITDIPVNMRERDEVIILLAKEKLKGRNEQDSTLNQKKMLKNTKDLKRIDLEELEDDLFEEVDDDHALFPAINQTVIVNDSIHFIKNSFNELGKLTERLLLTDSEKAALNYSSTITLNSSNVPQLNDSTIKQLYQEALLLTSSMEARRWISLYSRDIVLALLSLTGASIKKYQFTPLSELREIFLNRLLQIQGKVWEDENEFEEVEEVEMDLPSYKVPSLKQEGNRRIALRASTKKRRESIDDLLDAEKSILAKVFFSFIPRSFKGFISLITITMNQILGIFALDAIDWSIMNIPKLIHTMPKYSKQLASAEIPLISLIQGVEKITGLAFTWAGSNRYPSSIVATFVCSYTIINKGGLLQFLKNLLITKFITSILNQLKFHPQSLSHDEQASSQKSSISQF